MGKIRVEIALSITTLINLLLRDKLMSHFELQNSFFCEITVSHTFSCESALKEALTCFS